MSVILDHIRSIGRRNLLVALAATAVTSTVITGFLVESKYGYLPPDPLTIYVQSWKEGRTREETARQQKIDLAIKNAERAAYLREVAAANARADALRRGQ